MEIEKMEGRASSCAHGGVFGSEVFPAPNKKNAPKRKNVVKLKLS